MSAEERWTPHQTQVQREPKPCEVLWTLVKSTESRRADLRDHGVIGAELQIYVNGQFVNGQRNETRELAMLKWATLDSAKRWVLERLREQGVTVQS